ncbi:MAG: hypothetical protein ACLTG4_01335 [Oscillospiraceae bacterium]|jgi:hypothetical protein
MKKALSFVLAAVMLLSFSACGGGKNKKAFEVSKAAYNNVNSAYQITEEIASDVYEAWRLGISEKSNIAMGGCTYLAGKLHISKDEIVTGVAYTMAKRSGLNWDELSSKEKEAYSSNADSAFLRSGVSMFSWCVSVVVNAYIANGEVKKAQGYLTEAKEQMKELSDKYSDYEHYPALKGYFTTTSSFFEFCQDPTGSFNQLKTTMEDYETTARNYRADLDYIFED